MRARGGSSWSAPVGRGALLLLLACQGPADDAGRALDAGPTADGGKMTADGGTTMMGDGGGPLFRQPTLQACQGGEASQQVVRVMTWNVAIGRVSSIERVAAELVRVRPDVVLVQEVDVGTRRSGGVDQAQTLADALTMEHTYAATVPWDGGHFGMAVYARFPFTDVQVRWLDPAGAAEPRIGLSAWLCVGASTLRVVSFHGDHISKDSAARNAAELVQWVNVDVGGGVILAGDFNAEPTEGGPQSALAAGMVDLLAGTDPRPTFGQRRIDFMFADPRLARGAVAARVEPSDASDHLPLVVDLQFPPAPMAGRR